MGRKGIAKLGERGERTEKSLRKKKKMSKEAGSTFLRKRGEVDEKSL